MASISKKKKKKDVPKSTSEMSKEMLMETLKKKKECNSRALAIVERLCESYPPDENWFLANLASINQSHFEDVIVERAILKHCGYPLCTKTLQNVPSKKYHISTKHNKVFDITERKNFCSDFCYKAGMYVKNQLLTSPLWFRDNEIIPVFKLLSSSSSSGLGEEVVFLPEREQLKKDVFNMSESNKEDDLSATSERFEKMCIKNCDKNTKSDDNVKEKIGGNIEIIEDNTSTSKVDDEKEFAAEKTSVKVKKKEIVLDPVKKVERCIYEWFTLKTVLYLYGEEKVKDIMKNKEDKVKIILREKPLVPGYNEKIDMMIKFYSLLDDQTFDSDSVRKNLKPLPDYSAIKEDGKNLEVKVKAFYKGQLELTECDVSERKDNEGQEEENQIYLPTVDTHAHNTLRMKILLDRFNRIIPELIRTFTTASCFQISDLRNLVSHFTLSAHNITFKPGEWYLIGFIVIKLLAIKNKQLDCLLKSENGRKHTILFLMNYGLPQDYLENILEWLMNAEDLIKKLE